MSSYEQINLFPEASVKVNSMRERRKINNDISLSSIIIPAVSIIVTASLIFFGIIFMRTYNSVEETRIISAQNNVLIIENLIPEKNRNDDFREDTIRDLAELKASVDNLVRTLENN